jgi:hypothetical protein
MRARSYIALLCLAGCGAASPAPARPDARDGAVELYFPSALGTAWSYDVAVGEGPEALVIARVVAREGDLVAISVSGSEPNQYQLRSDGVFSTDAGVYSLKWPLEVGATWPSRGGGLATVVETSSVVATSAGRYEGCVLVREERPSPPATIETHFCPGVGVARLEVRMTLDEGELRTVTQLRGFAPGEP